MKALAGRRFANEHGRREIDPRSVFKWKAAAVIRMLERRVTPDHFNKVLQSFTLREKQLTTRLSIAKSLWNFGCNSIWRFYCMSGSFWSNVEAWEGTINSYWRSSKRSGLEDRGARRYQLLRVMWNERMLSNSLWKFHLLYVNYRIHLPLCGIFKVEEVS